jgi:manganese efflux pump family protein
VGFSLSLVGIAVWYPALFIGLAALIMAFIGTRIGKHTGTYLGQWAERAGGVVLIGIGLRILIEHLTF